MMAVTNQAHERRFLTHLLAAKREIKWIHDGVSLRRLVPPPHGRGGGPMVGGVRPSRCPRAMGKSTASAERRHWTNLAVSRAVWAVSVVLHEIIAVTDVI